MKLLTASQARDSRLEWSFLQDRPKLDIMPYPPMDYLPETESITCDVLRQLKSVLILGT